jgi:uncharacterized membrane protein
MDIISIALILLGAVIGIVGGIWFLVAAFREGVLWGLACLFIPIVQFFFLIVHWPEAKKPFFLQLLGIGLVVAGIIINPQAVRQ